MESDILRWVLETLERHPAVARCWRANTGAMRIGGRYVQFGFTGQPDIAGFLRGGRALYVETKRPGENPTPEQAEFLAHASRSGCVAFVARSIQDVIDNLRPLIRQENP